MVALGRSGKLSRFWSKINTPIGTLPFAPQTDHDLVRRGRFKIAFINQLADLKSDFKALQSSILSTGQDSIIECNKLLKKIEKDFHKFDTEASLFFSSIKEEEVLEPVSAPQQAANPAPVPDQSIAEKESIKSDVKIKLDRIGADIAANKNNFSLDKKKVAGILKGIEAYNDPNYKESKEELVKAIISAYDDIIMSLNQEFGTNESNLSDIIVKKGYAQTQLVAEAFVGKWLKRKRHQLNFFGTDSAIRLYMDDQCQKAIDEIDTCLSVLENDIDFDSFKKTIIVVDNSIKIIKYTLHGMSYDSNGKLTHDLFKSKDFDSKNVLKEKNLSEFQREQLNKAINQKIIRDMTRNYEGFSEELAEKYSLLSKPKENK